MTHAETRAYYRAYEKRRRDRCRANGICVQCGRARLRRRVSATGIRLTRCTRCIADLARVNAHYFRQRYRRGICRSCPRKRPPADPRHECPRCRRKRSAYGKAHRQQQRSAERQAA